MRTGDKETFKIVVIDDEPDSIGEQMDEIRLFLEEEYQLELIDDRYADPLGVLDKMDSAVDIVIIDRNLENSDGTDVVQEIRDRNRLLDIMLYSRGNLDYPKLEKITRHSPVEIAPTIEFVDKLKTIIERNLSKWSDIFFLRGSVISRIVDLEVEIDELLMGYFLPQNDTTFRNFILENGFFSLEAKKKILKEMRSTTNEQIDGLNCLEELQKKRNMLAHCKRDPQNPNILIRYGTQTSIEKKDIEQIFDKADMFSNILKSFKLDLCRSESV